MRCLAWLLSAVAVVGLGLSAGCDGHAPAAPSGHGAAHGGGAAHEDAHGHGTEEGPEPVRITLFTPKVELFMEHPPLVRGQEAEFLAHVTVLATGEPVRTGKLTFEATGPDGQPVTKVLEAPKRDGLFVPIHAFASAGAYKLRLVVNSPQVQETMEVGELKVHADAAAAAHAAEHAEAPEVPGAVPFLLEQQWKIGLKLGQAEKRTLVRRLTVPGQVVPPQGASAVVSAPVSGRLLPPPDGKLPRIGELVQAGQVLAMVEPPMPATEAYQLSANRAQVQALEMELALRELELDTKSLEIERAVIQARARLDFAKRTMQRAEELNTKGVGSQQQHEEARQNLTLAEAELGASEAMQKASQTSRERLNRLRAQTTQPTTLPAEELHQLPLRAPIQGRIVSATRSHGEHIEATTDEIFRIVNAERVWVQAQIPEADLGGLPAEPGANITFGSLPSQRFDVPTDGNSRLVHLGSVVDPETRAVTVTYELANPQGLLRIGMFADVHLQTQAAVDAVAVPEAAIVLDNGRPVVFALIDGESFQRRDVELGIRDGEMVQVLAGIEPGERVATKGAYVVKLSSLSPAAFGHGHGH